MNILLALWAGLLFGIGLILSSMTGPAKVLAFLDLAGTWDPSLGIVMGGALLAAMPAYAIARRQRRTLLDEPLQLPTATRIDRRLLVGSLVFGGGWGFGRLLPGAGGGFGAGGRRQAAAVLRGDDGGNGAIRAA